MTRSPETNCQPQHTPPSLHSGFDCVSTLAQEQKRKPKIRDLKRRAADDRRQAFIPAARNGAT
jgi:hypothetical protein